MLKFKTLTLMTTTGVDKLELFNFANLGINKLSFLRGIEALNIKKLCLVSTCECLCSGTIFDYTPL